MPRYNYYCEQCTISDFISSDIDGTEENELEIFADRNEEDFMTQDFIWEEMHGMFEKPKIRCPMCDKSAKKTMRGSNTQFQMRGHYIYNKAENLYHREMRVLDNNDPYKRLRTPGEVDHLKFEMTKAVKKIIRRKNTFAHQKELDREKQKPKKEYCTDIGKKHTSIRF